MVVKCLFSLTYVEDQTFAKCFQCMGGMASIEGTFAAFLGKNNSSVNNEKIGESANDHSCTTHWNVKGNYPSVSLVSVVIVHPPE